MPQVTFIIGDGKPQVVAGEEGHTILEIALANDVPIEHACGGSGFCTTCLCGIEDGKKMIDEGKVSPINDREENMGMTDPGERLGCQVKVIGDIVVKLEA